MNETKRLVLYFLLPSLIFFSLTADAQQDSLVSKHGFDNEFQIVSAISYLVEPSVFPQNVKSIREKLFTNSYESFAHELKTDYRTKNFWLRFYVSNLTGTVQHPYFNFGGADYVTLFVSRGDIFISSHGGLLQEHGNVNDTLHQFAAYLPATIFPKEQVEVFVKIVQQTHGLDFAGFKVVSADKLYKQTAIDYFENRQETIVQVLFQGFMLCQIIFIFLQWLFARSKDYLYYLMYLVLIALYFLSKYENILGEHIFFTKYPLAVLYLHDILLILPYFFSFRFSRIFLEMPIYFPVINKLMKNMEYLVITVVAINTVLLIIFFNAWLYFLIGTIAASLFFTFSFGIILYLLTQKQKQYGYYILFGGLVVGLGGIIGIVLSFLRFNLHLDIAMGIDNLLIFGQTGFLVEVILFTLALSQKKIVDARQVAELQMKALKAQMNPHFVFNSLSSIQESIVLGKTDAASRYLGKFSKLIRSVLENSEKQLIFLQQEIDSLQLYLELESFRFDDFSFRIDSNKIEDLPFIKLPAMLVQPYVENAIKHGLSHKEGDKKLKILFEEEGDQLLKVTIEDNGIGRRRAGIINQKRNSLHQSMGMKITEQRLHLQLKQSKDVRIVDLADSNGNATGTSVTIYINIES